MNDKERLTDFLTRKIYDWVGDNFGSQEKEDPSWNVEALSQHLAEELMKRGQKKLPLQDNELTILFKEEIDAGNEIDKVVAKIEELSGKVLKTDDDGVKRLAYRIQNAERARYIYIDVQLPKDSVVKLSRWLDIQDSVLRYVLVKVRR